MMLFHDLRHFDHHLESMLILALSRLVTHVQEYFAELNFGRKSKNLFR